MCAVFWPAIVCPHSPLPTLSVESVVALIPFYLLGKAAECSLFLSSVKLFDEIGIKDLLHNPHKCWNLNYFLGQSSTTLGSSS